MQQPGGGGEVRKANPWRKARCTIYVFTKPQFLLADDLKAHSGIIWISPRTPVTVTKK
jgi:hypothetical protein